EAHRGYNLDKEMDEDDFGIRNEQDYIAQYRRVLDYFDAFKVGMTATPAMHTTEIFGQSVHSYSYRQAVIDGYLVDQEPPYRIETALNTDGITYQKGECVQVFDEETGEIENLGEMEDELHFDVEHFNKKVINENFNRVVLREIVRNLDPEGQEKTLIFAARDSHADTIVTILKEEFEAMGVDLHRDAIEKITGSVYNNAELTKKFKNEQYPNIVVTVDLLTTGIDIPAICNLVFLRKVRSRILYEQMKGRATRLCPEIGKESFRIYDAVNLYEDMKHFTDMKPVVVNPTYTFSELVEQTERIETVDRLGKQRDQMVAKLNRKVKRLSDNQEESFKYYTQGKEATEFLAELKSLSVTELPEFIAQYKTLWEYLDAKVYRPQTIVISEHDDEVRDVKRGYGNAEKPEDYIEGFKQYIIEHRNEMMALNIICTRPQELDRKTLKELKLQLDEQGYNETALNTAWKSMKNEDIAADIIAYIRTLALDTAMVTPEERVKRAINKIKSSRDFTKIQLKWIDQFEKQLLAEKVLQRQDLDLQPFLTDGGFKRLDKLFNHELENLVNELNQELYTA
ncbi:MAG: type I restriction-modification system endonuclease, partial [Flavobacterium sp.]